MHEMSKKIQKTALATQRKKSPYGPAVQKKSQSAAEFLKPSQKQPVQFFDRKRYKFGGRVQPSNQDGLGNPEDKVLTTGALQRDHIIPLTKIRTFADIVFESPPTNLVQTPEAVAATNEKKTAGDEWLKAAGKNFRDRARGLDTTFYMGNSESFSKVSDEDLNNFLEGKDISSSGFQESEYMEMLSKAITWMPANIFMAPHPKIDDGKDGLDTTAEPVVGKEYPKYKEAYDNMEAVIQNPKKIRRDQKNPTQLDRMKTAALINLKEIAEMRNEPWPFDEAQWECIAGKWKVKSNDGQEAAVPEQEDADHAQEAAVPEQEDADHAQEAAAPKQEDADHSGADA